MLILQNKRPMPDEVSLQLALAMTFSHVVSSDWSHDEGTETDILPLFSFLSLEESD